MRRTEGTTNGVEMLMPCFAELYEELGIAQRDIGFWCSGSSDYLAGRAFSFISAIDSIGAVPPINESHVEMDAALYEAYIKLLTGEVDTALVYGFGKSSAGILRRVLALQTDPYTVAPLARIRCRSRACRPGSGWTRASGPPSRWRRWRWIPSPGAAHRFGETGQEHRRTAGPAVFRRPVAPPRHRADHRRRVGDRAGRGDKARELRENPAWITGFEHRIETPVLGART